MQRAPYDSFALASVLLVCSAFGCSPAEHTRKSDLDASIPVVDAGDPLERFCAGEGADGGCSCFANTCSRSCAAGECQGLEIICPHGQDCLVDCVGEGACTGLLLECESGDADCALRCADGACAHARYRCNDVIGANCCLCDDSSEKFTCPRTTGPHSCDSPAPAGGRRPPT